MWITPAAPVLEEELDQNHDDHRHKYDETGKDHEGAWEGLDTGVIDEGVERVGDEVNEAGDEGKTGEYSSNFRALDRLT